MASGGDDLMVAVKGISGDEEMYTLPSDAIVRHLKNRICEQSGAAMDSFILCIPDCGDSAPLASDMPLCDTGAPLPGGILTLQQRVSDRVYAQGLLHDEGILPGGYQERLYAIATGARDSVDDVHRLELLLMAGANPNEQPTTSFFTTVNLGSPLLAACRRQHSAVICALVDHGADLEESGGETPLSIACYYGKAEAVAYLLRAGADALVPGITCPSVLAWACYSGCPDTVRHVLQHLQRLAEGSGVRLEGATPEERMAHLLQGNDPLDMKTPLHLACSRGSLGCVRLLAEHGAPLFPKKSARIAPITMAVKNGFSDLAAWMLQQEDPGHDYLLDQLLVSAAQGLQSAVAFYVTDRGVRPDEVMRGSSALTAAKGHPQILKFLNAQLTGRTS